MSRPRSLSSERGVALPVVLGCLLVLSILAAGLLTTATRSSSNTNESRASKRALGAAEAGLQTAAYRLKKLKPAGNMCMTTGPIAPAAGGECPASAAEPVAARATFQYWVTPEGAACGALPGSTASAYDRCITSVGIVNAGRPDEVRRRIQARVEFGPQQPFSIAGIVGTDSVTLTNKVKIDKTDVGSNGPIRLEGTPGLVEIKDAVARPYPPGPPGGTVTRTGLTTITGGIVNSPSKYGLTQPDFAPSRNPNNNNNQLSYYNAATRTLNIPAGVTYLMPPGTYNLCKWTMNSGSKIDMSPKLSAATIYLESPRSDPTCTAPGSGQFKALGGPGEVKMNNGQIDANIRVFVYGTTANASAEDIVMQGPAHIDAVWFAPDSIFRASGGITMHGGAVARHVRMYNDVDARLDVAFESITIPGGGVLTGRAWFECRPVPTNSADPESGC